MTSLSSNDSAFAQRRVHPLTGAVYECINLGGPLALLRPVDGGEKISVSNGTWACWEPA